MGPTQQRNGVRGFPIAVVAFAIAGLVLRLMLATTSVGTADIASFKSFAATISSHGPLAIYHLSPKYNHPPLVGLLLPVIKWVGDRVFGFRVVLRLTVILSDFALTFLAWRIARIRFPPRQALFITATIALNPILIFISGFHGNLDPIFVFLLALGIDLLIDRSRPALAGMAVAAATGIKLVPLIAFPVLIFVSRKRRQEIPFVAGFLGASTVIWLPPLLVEWRGVVVHALGYRSQFGQWGIQQIAFGSGVSQHVLDRLRSPMGLTSVVLAVLASVWALRRTQSAYASIGVALAALLFFAPGWGAQYMSWPAAFVLFVEPTLGLFYVVAGGAFLFKLYTRWSGGFPWHLANTSIRVDRWGIALGFIAWGALGVVLVYGLRRAQNEREIAMIHSPSALLK